MTIYICILSYKNGLLNMFKKSNLFLVGVGGFCVIFFFRSNRENMYCKVYQNEKITVQSEMGGCSDKKTKNNTRQGKVNSF